MGLNCSFGATELHPYVSALNPQVDEPGVRLSQCRPAQRASASMTSLRK